MTDETIRDLLVEIKVKVEPAPGDARVTRASPRPST